MTYYNELTTVDECRSEYHLIGNSDDDKFILKLIRDVSRQCEGITNRHFAPRIETHYFDVPHGNPYLGAIAYSAYVDSFRSGRSPIKEILFDDDLLALTTLLNGDGTTIASTDYLLEPYNRYPKRSVRLKETSTVAWQSDSAGSYESVVSVSGIWGFHQDYANSWANDGASVKDATGINASVTSVTVPTGTVLAGNLLKCESEFMYASIVNTGTTDTVTVVRGVNGSTAIAHVKDTAIYRWDYGPLIELARRAVAGFYKLRNNPTGETIVLDGATFATPRDITAYIAKTLNQWGGFSRTGLA